MLPFKSAEHQIPSTGSFIRNTGAQRDRYTETETDRQRQTDRQTERDTEGERQRKRDRKRTFIGRLAGGFRHFCIQTIFLSSYAAQFLDPSKRLNMRYMTRIPTNVHRSYVLFGIRFARMYRYRPIMFPDYFFSCVLGERSTEGIDWI